MMATDGLRLVLTRDSFGRNDGWEARREGASYSPRTRLRRALGDRALKGFPDFSGGDPARQTAQEWPDWSKAVWLVQILAHEGDAEGVIVGVSSKRSGLLLGPRKRDRIVDLSGDGRHLVVHFAYAEQTGPVNNIFRLLFNAAQSPAEDKPRARRRWGAS